MLVDSVEVELKAGHGGDGVISWRREKFVPRGGPDGGDGGRGGSVILKASHNLDTLADFRYRKHFSAENGQNGSSKKKTGRSGQDLELLVPVGTVVTNVETGRVVADLTVNDQTLTVARGGHGGLGNVHFATATHQNPFEATHGQAGESLTVNLQLQLVADVALVGEPNAGKSTLISALTGAKARIGAFPFSTTDPVLGVIKVGGQAITVIDLPGLIEGAHRGRGLGTKFLQHTGRVKLILLLAEATSDIDRSKEAVRSELIKYDPALRDKPQLLVLTKADLLTKGEIKKIETKYPDAILISAKSRHNLDQLTRQLTLDLDN